MNLRLRRLLPCISLLLLCLSWPVHAVQVAGVDVPPTVTLAGQELHLSGAGLRTKYFFRAYVAALYTTGHVQDAASVLTGDAPKLLSIHLLRDVDAEDFAAALDEGLQANNAPAELETLRSGIERLRAIMLEVKEAKKHSVVTLGCTGDTLIIGYNGQERGRLSSPALERALLKVWLGDHPVQESLKKALLGGV